MDEIRTHRLLDRTLCGEPIRVEEGRAEVNLSASRQMAADAPGLIHGGFVFGAADHAAMLAVNEPTVVLVRADVRFVAPVAVGDRMVARARVVDGSGDARRPVVEAEVEVAGRTVFSGTFECALPERHVLDTDGDGSE